MNKTLIIGTRTSRLALWQTEHIIFLLQRAWPQLDCQTRPFVTQGDKTLHLALPQIGGKGLFTQELERALREGEIDLAVHSLKDLPVENAPGLTLGALVGRADVRDVLVARNGWTLETLPHGAVVGTSSLRRQAQLLHYRSDLRVKSIRGNVETRVRKVQEGQYDAAIMAAAGLLRLGHDSAISQYLPMDVMLPAPGQGVLAVQCRADDQSTLQLLNAIHQPAVAEAACAERAFLYALDAGCSTPVAAFALPSTTSIHLIGLVAASDGSRVIQVEGEGDDPRALGERLAAQALRQGATEILAYAV